MNCPACNAQIRENEVYCKNCGTPLTIKQRAFSTYKENPITKPLKTSDFLLIFILKSIPLVNLIVFIVWSISATNLNRKAYARAKIIWAILETVVLTVLLILLLPYYKNFISC